MILACVMSVALAACHNAPTAPRDSITVTGFAERGASVTLAFLRGGTAVAPALVTWSATPAFAVTIATDGDARFSDTGSVMFTGQDGDASALITVHVKSPPVILFDMQDSGGLGNRDVYTAALDGSGLAQLTSGTSDNEQPASAHGNIVFTSFRDGHAALYTVPVGGGAGTPIASIPAPSDQASVSADGTTLAFISTSRRCRPSLDVGDRWEQCDGGDGQRGIRDRGGSESQLVGVRRHLGGRHDPVRQRVPRAYRGRGRCGDAVDGWIIHRRGSGVESGWRDDRIHLDPRWRRRALHSHRLERHDQTTVATPRERRGSRLAPGRPDRVRLHVQLIDPTAVAGPRTPRHRNGDTDPSGRRPAAAGQGLGHSLAAGARVLTANSGHINGRAR